MKLVITSLLFVCIFSSLTFTTSSQVAQNLEFQKTFGGTSYDEAISIIGLPNGKSLIAGYTYSNIGSIICPSSSNFWIFQLDSTLNLEWMKCFGGSGSDEPKCIKKCSDGGYILIGRTNSKDGDVIGLHDPIFNPFWDIWVLKLDSSANIEWQKCFGGSLEDEGYDISITNDGGYILVGDVGSMDGDIIGNHGFDLWICKLNSIGSIVWSKCLGGYDYDVQAYCIQTQDGGYLVTGTTLSLDSLVPDNHGENGTADAWVVRLDSLGNVKWTKCYGGTDSDNGQKIFPTWDGGFYLVCNVSSQDGDVGPHLGNISIWLIRADSLGTIIWQKTYGGINADLAYNAIRTSDGGIAVVGETRGIPGLISVSHGFGDFSIIKVDSLGNAEWGNAFGGSDLDMAYSIYECENQSFVLAGVTSSNDFDVTNYQGNDDAWVVKLAPANVSVSELENSFMDLKIFQNNNQIFLRFFSKKNETGQVYLYDVNGKKVFEKNLSVNEGINYSSLNCEKFSSGMYLVKIESEKGWQSGKVFIN